MDARLVVDVDLTSLFGLSQALTVEAPSSWALGCYYDVSLAFLDFPRMRVPSPANTGAIPRIIVQPIQDKLETYGPLDAAVRNEATAYTRNMATEDVSFFRDRLQRLRPTPDYQAWLGWHVEHEWVSHIHSLDNNLVETDNIPTIARILDRPVGVIKDANAQAANDATRVCRNPSELHKDIYAVDVALRGRYYEKLSTLTGSAFLMHPIRRSILRDGVQISGYSTPVTARLGAIVGNWARTQPMESRVEEWTDMIFAAKTRYQHWSELTEYAKLGPEAIAVAIAKDIGIVNPVRMSDLWGPVLGGVVLGVGLIIEVPGVPEAFKELGAVGLSNLVDIGLGRLLKVVERSSPAIRGLSDRNRRYGGRVFSYKDIQKS